ncbi:DUF928 domain-containing protein [Microseira sp. BLCC-F43]|jgi:hypothetical protein|uniref:DUF928 domain-containing protein n=1 Tax=Microseira sp. BLCC-F43 TaxID=3153602 RepID=UPI0035BB0D5C
MTQFKTTTFTTLLSATLSGVAVIASSFYQSVQATPKPIGQGRDVLISLRFEAPGEAAPRSTIGGGTRGSVRFAAPGEVAPNNTTGGGTRGNVKFAPPEDAAPVNTTGGGTRGNVRFAAPGEATPRNTIGGGSRGNVRFQTPGESAPANTASGGTRTEGQALTALLPTTRYGRTVAARPTFFVYLPPTASKEVFFSVQDERRNHHYQTILKISGKGGIVSFTLPEDAPELEIGKNYVWFFAPIQPGGILQPDNNGAIGWIRRVESQTAQNATKTPLERATEYAQQGIWYDTLAILAEAKLTQPGNATLASEWKDLLKEVGLEAIANQPLAEQL